MSILLIFLWILGPITFILLVLFIYLLTKSVKKTKKNNLVKKIDAKIRKNRIKKLESIVSRVRIISSSNSQYKDLYEQLVILCDDIKKKLNDVINDYASLIQEIKFIKLKKIKIEINEISKMINEINDQEYEFYNLSDSITNQDNFMRSEIAFYTKNMRRTLLEYENKKIFMSKINFKIKKIIQDVNGIERSFNESLEKINLELSSLYLKKYGEDIVKLANIINVAPLLQTCLYETIPQHLKKIIYFYKKNNKKYCFDALNFQNLINKIEENLAVANTKFLELDLITVEKKVNLIVLDIKNIENLINNEIKAMNFFDHHYTKVEKQNKITLKMYLDFQKELKLFSKKNYVLPNVFIGMYEKLQKDIQNLNKLKVDINLSHNNNVPFSSKIIKLKKLLEENFLIINSLNELNFIIWKLSVKDIIINNQILQLESALEKQVIHLNQYDVRLENKEKNLFLDLYYKIFQFKNTIFKNEISQKNLMLFYKLLEEIINVYLVVVGKIKLAEISHNIILFFANLRLVNKKLNNAMADAENFYLQGEYVNCLNLIVNTLERK